MEHEIGYWEAVFIAFGCAVLLGVYFLVLFTLSERANKSDKGGE